MTGNILLEIKIGESWLSGFFAWRFFDIVGFR